MRILITQRALVDRGGSEMVTIELARALAGRGHEVAVYSPRLGDLAKLMLSRGVWPRSRLSELPWTPDVIHGHHHLTTTAALAHFDASPAVYHCHGVSPWVERPPIHPRIHRYVMMCAWLARRVTPEYGIPADRIRVVPNFVDTQRFSTVRPAADRIARAVIFGNDGLPAAEVQRLEAACAAQDISLERAGAAFGNPQPRPEMYLPAFDLVFAVGRCALEALACGCAVVPIIPGQAGHLVTPDNLDSWADSNFSPLYFTSAVQIGDAWLAAELREYSPAAQARVTERVREAHALDRAVTQLESVYGEARDEHGAHGARPCPREFAAYLETMAYEGDQLWIERMELATHHRIASEAGQRHEADASRARAELADERAQASVAREEVARLSRALAARSVEPTWHEMLGVLARKIRRRLP